MFVAGYNYSVIEADFQGSGFMPWVVGGFGKMVGLYKLSFDNEQVWSKGKWNMPVIDNTYKQMTLKSLDGVNYE